MLAQEIKPFTLRDYQNQVIYDAYNLIRQVEKRILVFSPTGAGKPPLKLCPLDKGGCGSYVYSFQMKCSCGYNFEVNKLIEILGSSRLISPDDEIKLTVYRSLLREAFEKKYAPSWALVKFKEKYGFSPPFDWGRGAIFDGDHSQQKQYKRYLKEVSRRMKKDKDWVEKYLRLEFGKV